MFVFRSQFHHVHKNVRKIINFYTMSLRGNGNKNILTSPAFFTKIGICDISHKILEIM
jgi:hypothetical protein